MKKSTERILSLVILLTLLIVASIMVYSKDSKKQPLDSQAVSELNTEKTLSVIDLDKNDLKSIRITNDDTTLCYTPNGEVWDIEDYTNQTIDKENLNFRLNELLKIEASQCISCEDLSSYGLDKPSKSAIYTLKNGETITLHAGLFTLDKKAIYVYLESDAKKVYLVPSLIYNCLANDYTTYLDTEVKLPSIENIAKLELSLKGQETVQIEHNLQNAMSDYLLSSTELKDVSTDYEGLINLLDAFPTLTMTTILADHVTDLKPYGLDDPTLHLKVSYYNPKLNVENKEITANASLDFIWGTPLEDGSIPFMNTLSDVVYTMPADFIESIKEKAHPFKLCHKSLGMYSIQDVASIDIVLEKDMVYQLILKPDNYSINGKPLTEEALKEIYRELISLKADIALMPNQINTQSEECIQITYTFNNKEQKVITLSTSKDDLYYQTTLYSHLIVGCSKKQVDSLMSLLATK